MKELFEQLINTGVENLEMVEPAQKSAICAELAKAIAMSGLLVQTPLVAESIPAEEVKKEEKKEDKKPATKGKGKTKSKTEKEALKPEAGKGKKEEKAPAAPAEEPVAEAPQEPVVEEPVVTPQSHESLDEWTPELTTEKKEQLALLQAYVEAWGEDYVYNDCLGAFTNNVLQGAGAVRPSNIDGFVVYLQQLSEQFSNQE